MKNFPDHDSFNGLEKRLESYTELPDDAVWSNIDATLRQRRRWALLPWLDGMTSLCLAGLLTFAIADNKPADKSIEPSHTAQPNREPTSSVSPSIQQLKTDTGIKNTRGHTSTTFASNGIIKEETSPAVVVNRAQQNYKRNETEASDSLSVATTVRSSNSSFEEEQLDSISVQVNVLKTDSSNIVGEEKNSKQLRKRKHTFYAMVTPSLSFHRADPVSRDGIVVTRFANKSILSGGRFGFSINAGVQGYISKRLDYYGGLSFYHQNQTIEYEYLSDKVILEEAEDGYTVSPKSAVGIVNYKMVNMGVEAGVLYHLYGKLLTHKIGAGFSYQQGLSASRSEEYTNSRSSYLSYQLFYRNELRINSRLKFFVQPVFVQAIAVNEKLDAPFKMKPYRAGLGFGILYGF
jgi:hypothetical protein